MCGIAGIAALGSNELPGADVISAMVQTLHHRGPDASGIYRGRSCLLGNARLSIIDLDSGDQPMSAWQGRFTIVYNGELYNFREIRQRLERDGLVFSTQSDTEVILRAFTAHGQGALPELNGIFSFAIWDRERRSLFLARDHLGIKPLYYARTGGYFVFGSEIKAIFASGLVPKRVNTGAIFDHLCRQEPTYLQTMFDGIFEVEPGTWMEVSSSGSVRRGTYFKLEEDWLEVESLPKTVESATRLLQERIRDCVRRQMVSDVPVGIALSGGIDSALVYKNMIEAIPHTLDAFTYANVDAEINEAAKAADVIGRFGGEVRHHVAQIELPDHIASFQEACRFMDGPLTYQSSVPILKLSRLASGERIKVLMSGQGGDELFMGYVRYRRWIDEGLLLEKDIETWAQHLYFGAGLDKMDRVERLTGLSRESVLEGRVYRWVFEHQDLPPLKRMAIFDQKFRLMYLLKRDDRMGMGGSVEIRVPFLDKELVSWANALDDRWKINNAGQKYILNQVGKNSLPESVIKAPKLGSPTDFQHWINTLEFTSTLMDLVCESGSFSREYLRFDEVKRMVSQHRETLHFAHLCWCVFSLEQWYRACFQDANYPG